MLVVDQRMPEMTGVEFLEAARRLDPLTRRVILTAYADTEAAIDAINRAGVSLYIQKPWDPPEEKLVPATRRRTRSLAQHLPPGFSGIRVIGDRWSASTHRIKELLARNQVPYRPIDAGGPEGQMLLEAVGVATGAVAGGAARRRWQADPTQPGRARRGRQPPHAARSSKPTTS